MTMRPSNTTRTQQRGVLLTDTLIGLSLTSVLLACLAYAVGQQGRTADHLAEQRALVHHAEAALHRAQIGAHKQTDAHAPDITVTWRNVEHDQAPPGYQWVKVTARDGAKSATLTGLVPTQAAERLANREGTRP